MREKVHRERKTVNFVYIKHCYSSARCVLVLIGNWPRKTGQTTIIVPPEQMKLYYQINRLNHHYIIVSITTIAFNY